eukprot:CAMPEP_0182531062 /NCGR_PEP_ID=MMETSP1323-20130603/7689_1 /TAXON_ID=236787 /ORGANISM="Florenciella parvula, Strain RCC1693" /LENGTH=100 /DNA_ID=CAMNT_0024740525 /DNA_START=24 /DNA_END=324 /DNA_ORIENTATION=-
MHHPKICLVPALAFLPKPRPTGLRARCNARPLTLPHMHRSTLPQTVLKLAPRHVNHTPRELVSPPIGSPTPSLAYSATAALQPLPHDDLDFDELESESEL